MTGGLHVVSAQRIVATGLTYGMDSLGLLPPGLARVLPERRTPWVVFTGGLQVLAETVVLLLLFVFISTNVSVLVLRKDRVEEDRFQVVTIVPILEVINCLVLLTRQSAGR